MLPPPSQYLLAIETGVFYHYYADACPPPVQNLQADFATSGKGESEWAAQIDELNREGLGFCKVRCVTS